MCLQYLKDISVLMYGSICLRKQKNMATCVNDILRQKHICVQKLVLSRKISSVQRINNSFNFKARLEILKWEYHGQCKSTPFQNLHPSLKTEGVIDFLNTKNPYFSYSTKGDKLPIANCKNQENAGKSYIFCMISFIYI